MMGDFNIYTDFVDMKPLIDLFRRKGEMVEYKRNAYFCNVGDGCKYIGYIETGAFRFTHDGSDGKDHILSYAFENDFVGSYSSLQNQGSTLFNIQAIRKSILYRLSVLEVNAFLNSNLESPLLGRRILEVLLYSLAQRLVSLYCNTPEERYVTLVKRCPDILNRVSLRELSSFLMIPQIRNLQNLLLISPSISGYL